MEKQYYSFIVKIHDGGKRPRGYIERISSRQRAYFNGLSQMNKFISGQLTAPAGENCREPKQPPL